VPPALHWFDDCGHFPHRDQPADAMSVILDTVRYVVAACEFFVAPGAHDGRKPSDMLAVLH